MRTVPDAGSRSIVQGLVLATGTLPSPSTREQNGKSYSHRSFQII